MTGAIYNEQLRKARFGNQHFFYVNSFISCLNSHYVFLNFCSTDVQSCFSSIFFVRYIRDGLKKSFLFFCIAVSL